MDIGDLVQFKRDSTCAPEGSLGLIVDQRFLKRMEPGKGGYLLYDVMTFDGKVRHVSVTSVVNQNLHAKVEQLNTEIARRINELQSPGSKVWQLQCNFKPCAGARARL